MHSLLQRFIPLGSQMLAHAQRTADPAMAKAAALWITRIADLHAPAGWLGVTSLAAKPKPLTTHHPVIQHQHTLLTHARMADGWDEAWAWRLITFDELMPEMSRQQQQDVLHLLLTNAVTRMTDDRWQVQGSRAYTVTLTDGTYDGGFTCTCKAFYANGAGKTLCKHVIAATIAAFAQHAMEAGDAHTVV